MITTKRGRGRPAGSLRRDYVYIKDRGRFAKAVRALTQSTSLRRASRELTVPVRSLVDWSAERRGEISLCNTFKMHDAASHWHKMGWIDHRQCEDIERLLRGSLVWPEGRT